MEERLRFVARRLGVRHLAQDRAQNLRPARKAHKLEALADRPRRPGRVANRLPMPVEAAIGPLRRLPRRIQHRTPARGAGDEDPAAVYGSPRAFAGLPELAYPFHDRDAIVARNGAIGLHGRAVIISTVFEGQRFGLREVDADVWRGLLAFPPGFRELRSTGSRMKLDDPRPRR